MPNGKGRNILLHRIVMGRIQGRTLENHEWVDHRDHNPMNARDENLRLVTVAQNSQHRRKHIPTLTNPFRGVCWDIHEEKWRAQLTYEGKRYYLGHYNNVNEANEVCVSKRKELRFYDGTDESIGSQT
jgi:hypothetical protein